MDNARWATSHHLIFPSSDRARLNQKHRENVWRAVARRLADQEEQAEMDEDYEIETAKDSGDEGQPELQWIM